MLPAKYDFPTLYKGNSREAWEIIKDLKFSDSGASIPIASVKMQIKTPQNVLIYTYDSTLMTPNVTISGADSNYVTLSALSSGVTSGFTIGQNRYDLQIVTVSGSTWTILKGLYPVVDEVTS